LTQPHEGKFRLCQPSLYPPAKAEGLAQKWWLS
jgi:hypothetical protein